MQTKQFPKSPHERIHGLVYLPRMLDKIRLHTAGKLPEEYLANLGHPEKFDGACLHFLGVDYESIVTLINAGATDEEAWEWCLHHGKRHTEEELSIWNSYMQKYGWRDEGSAILQRRLQEGGYGHHTDIQTLFDYIDLDEGRSPNSNNN